MRLTIVSPETFTVLDVYQAPAADLLHCVRETNPDHLYPGAVWFVTVTAQQPDHAQHNQHGQIVNRHSRIPVTGWSKPLPAPKR